MFRFARLTILLALILFCRFVLISSAQEARGGDAHASLHGVVTDSTGALIPGVTITVKPAGNEAAFTAVTNREGQFTISNLVPGFYEISAEQLGFNRVYRTVNLADGQTTDISLPLIINLVSQNVTVTAQTTAVTEAPTAQTITSVDRQDTKDSADFTIQESLALVPGITTITGNGPRDISISLRGSNDRQSYGIRNAILFDDGFQVTQPDGLGRADLIDPHAYESIDAVQGPSSTMYGNNANDGAIFFHTRPGADVHGIDFGTDAGSYQFLNNYVTIGNAGNTYDYSVFLSNTRGKQSYQDHFAFNTATANILTTFSLRKQDRITFKFINNDLDTELPIRLSLNQYLVNPFQEGCSSFSSGNPADKSCATVSLYANGFTGSKVSLSADEAGLGRHDRRTIVGARWEHDLTDNTTWRTQGVWDVKDIDQPTGATSARGSTPSFILLSDGTRKGLLFGRRSTTYGGGFFKYEDTNSNSYNVMPGGNATLGAYVSGAFGTINGAGFRIREELALGEHVTIVGGFGYEHTSLSAQETLYHYSTTGAPSTQVVNANRIFNNVAPEAAILLRASDSLRIHARLGTGYGTPTSSSFFVTPQGTYGNNTQLKAQTNVGIDLGADWFVARNIELSLTGFYERFTNENVNQSPGADLLNYTFNAPSSAHRGLVAGLNWHPFPGSVSGLRFRAAYQYDAQVYRDYTERLSAGSFSTSFVRNGNRIPGVVPNNLNARLIYDRPSSRYGNFGSYLEANYRSGYWLDNANLLPAPSATVLNFDVHYDPAPEQGFLSRTHFYFDLQNLTNRTYAGSASNISNTISSTTGEQNSAASLASATGSIYAGAPRLSIGGFRIKF
jgi:iron complex outermembrane receptor protein